MGVRSYLSRLTSRKKKRTGIVELQVDNYKLLADASHPIQDYLTVFKYYSRNIPRVAKHIEAKYPVYAIIDVGANIGDTLALLRSAGVDQQVYLFEGEASYFGLLQKNLSQFDKATAFETFLGEEDTLQAGAVKLVEGTGRVDAGDTKQINVRKIDSFAVEHHFEAVKLLKVDTDGFDFKILRGSFGLIRKDKPVLFFEYDPVYLKQNDEPDTRTFTALHQLGYNKAIYYDNFGKMLLSTTLGNKQQIDQLHNYMSDRGGAFSYYDVCLFHTDDDALADEVIAREMELFK